MPLLQGLILSLMALGIPVNAAPRPHIVLVMADDQGWGQVGYMEHPYLAGRTPHLDAMAKAGLRFNRFYAAAPICSPTRASVMTGRIPERTGVPGLHKPLCLQEKTLPNALKDAGYATALFGKWHLNGIKGPGMPILAEDPHHPGRYGFDTWLATTNFFENDPLMSRDGAIEYLPGESSELMVEEALRFMAAHPNQPTLTVIWYGSPHHPFICSSADRAGFPEGKHGDQLGEIVAMDRSVGQLRQGLRDLGIEDRTLLWFTSDNGGLEIDPDSVGILRGNKGSLYEGGIRVPAIIEWPGAVAPRITDYPASTMDILPTLVDLLELPEDALLPVTDGRSLRPLLNGESPTTPHLIPFTTKGLALIEGRFKLIQVGRGVSAPWELYDLETDPGERVDVSLTYPERYATMRGAMVDILDSVHASAHGHDYPEGRRLLEPTTESWFEMESYQRLYERFIELKPSWKAPR